MKALNCKYQTADKKKRILARLGNYSSMGKRIRHTDHQLKTVRSIYRDSRSVFTLIEVTKQNVYCELEGDREYRMIYKGPGFLAVE